MTNAKADIINLSEHQLHVQHNGELSISTGRSRFETAWKNRKIMWSALLLRLSKSTETPETHAEYMKMSKEQQDKIKDVGGFVGGHLKEGRRKSGTVMSRQILTLDLDFAPADFWDCLMNNLEITGALAVHSTHKHSAGSPRFRLIMPLDREVSPDEYEAIARKVAEKIGIDFFDDSTFQPARLMYWPSHSTDVDPFFKFYDAPFLETDSVLAEYPDWTDTSFWPESSRMTGIRKKQADRQGDPLKKKGIVGAFCRTYSIPEAIAAFLPEVYIETTQPGRYTYAAGSTAAGLVIYDGDTFAFSNHGTDPASGLLCNAFDLVRIHKFSHLDDGLEDKSGKDLPSFNAMAEFASDDPGVKQTIVEDNRARAAEDFKEPAEDADAWKRLLDVNDKGNLVANAKNALLILQHDENLKGFAYNELTSSVEVSGEMPWERSDKFWRDADDAQLFLYVAINYRVNFTDKIFSKAFTKVTDDQKFNPLKEYVKNLPEWDGEPRVDTLLIDYLGADDTPYTRTVTRKTLIGAIQRALWPGCKFDNTLVLNGKQRIGKSTLLRKLGGEWFSDSLSLLDARDKTGAEKLKGVWIMEIGEMRGTRKADTDMIKNFLSCQVDEYRVAYGRVVEKHPRTAIICGTTNSVTGFLRDTTGNRRFWPVYVRGGTEKSSWDITEEIRAQIWAEALVYTKKGEKSYLDPEMEEIAAKVQQDALEYDEREGEVVDYLNTLLPKDWYDWSVDKRVDFFQQRDVLSPKIEATMTRKEVCSREIFCECFGRPKNQWKKQDGYEIAGIMARLSEWERAETATRIKGYGKQRVFVRKREDF